MTPTRFARSLLALVLSGQLLLADLAIAAEASPSPQPSPTASVSPSPSPRTSPSPSPSASPQALPTASPKIATAAPSPSPSPSPTPTITPEPKRSKDDHPSHVGVIPKWVFDTTSGTWIAAESNSFAFDPTSGYWLSPKYYYDTQSGWYKLMPAATAGSPTLVTSPHTVTTPAGTVAVGSPDYVAAQKLGLISADGTPVHVPGGSTDAATNSRSSSVDNGWIDLTNLVDIVNTLRSTATSGNATTRGNIQTGDTSTGSAMVVANLINLLSSAWSWSNGSLNFFMKNMFGDQHGDLTLQPGPTTSGGGAALGTPTGNSSGVHGTSPSFMTGISRNDAANLTVQAKQSGAITNNVSLDAKSGDATARENTATGNVSTGDATAQANVINLINSLISSGNSFFGILNIFGSLNGDVLFPQGFLDVAQSGTSTPSSSLSEAGGSGTKASFNTSADTHDQAAIGLSQATGVTNIIGDHAQSGDVTVSGNTASGSAASGASTSMNNLFSIVNQSISGDNAVLVMVNVLGHWVGKIMSLPGGGSTTSALLTRGASSLPRGDLTNSGSGPSVKDNSVRRREADIAVQTKNRITNNLDLTAQSGNAAAVNNTLVGSVKTGAAKVVSSAANLVNSAIAVKHWFGVLVVNVFGNWTGDLNHDSPAGGTSSTSQTSGSVKQPVPTAGHALNSSDITSEKASFTHVPNLVLPAPNPAQVAKPSGLPVPSLQTVAAHPSIVAATAQAPTSGSGLMPVALLIGSSLLLAIGFIAGVIERFNNQR